MRTYVISIIFQGHSSSYYLKDEFLKLASSLSALDIRESSVLRLSKIDPALYISKGQLQRIRDFVSDNDIGLVLFDGPLTPIQQRNLEKKLVVKVLDRTGLVLEIFGSRAKSREGMLQVELAHLLHQKSRLVRSWTHLERQRGGKGFLGGPGETQIESDRRNLASKIINIRKSIGKVRNTRGVQRSLRQKKNIPLVSFVGYTTQESQHFLIHSQIRKQNQKIDSFQLLTPF